MRVVFPVLPYKQYAARFLLIHDFRVTISKSFEKGKEKIKAKIITEITKREKKKGRPTVNTRAAAKGCFQYTAEQGITSIHPVCLLT